MDSGCFNSKGRQQYPWLTKAFEVRTSRVYTLPCCIFCSFKGPLTWTTLFHKMIAYNPSTTGMVLLGAPDACNREYFDNKEQNAFTLFWSRSITLHKPNLALFPGLSALPSPPRLSGKLLFWAAAISAVFSIFHTHNTDRIRYWDWCLKKCPLCNGGNE